MVSPWASSKSSRLPAFTIIRPNTLKVPPSTAVPPPWARFVRLEFSDSTLSATTFVELLDVNATPRARYPVDQQPNPGVPLGDASTVRCVLPTGSYAWRVVFLLHL